MAESKKSLTLRSIILMVLVVFVFPLIPMLISGQWGWWEAWTYAILSILGFVLSRVLAARRHPDILAERARSIELQGAKSWDKILAPMLAFGSLLILVVAGVDRIYGWTDPYSLNAKIISLVVILLGYVVGSWALIENRYFSGVVRIQKDRDHHVVTTGPYRFIRHPGYAGALWTYLATPVLLDSNWAFIPALLLLGVLILRTFLEDRTLQTELPGYAEYAQRIRFRLLPGIW
ncbi:MAG TPA: isoprenylcysteine carboxylmethyltransferase family protein [Anaerolineales bacterium]|nr:isoprenylcysteine carboxylmethyltransferase family protein [Anaerolineales bacterium]